MNRMHEDLDDDGYTIMEVVVAMIVIAIGLLGLMAVQVRSLSTVQLAKERQTATALANRAMEQLRAVPYTVLQGGLKCTELVGDPDVTVTNPSGACTATFSPSYDSSISGETVVTTTGTQVAPLSPHVPASDTSLNGAAYRVRTYVTRVDPTADVGYWLTVISSWTSGNARSARKVIALRSRVYSPSGCLSPTTHPFSGPCQAFFYSDAGGAAGSLSVTANRAGLPLVDGMTATSGSISLADYSSRTQFEQSLSTQSSFITALATLLDPTVSSSGGVTGSSSADTDPGTGALTAPTSATTGSQSSGTLSSAGGGSRLDVTPADSQSGSAYATTVAGASPVCVDDNNATISGGQNCASASIAPGGTSSLQLTLNSLGSRNMVLADLAAAGSTSRAFGARFPTPSVSPAHCTLTSGAGCVAAGVHRTLGTVRAGGLATASGSDAITNAVGANVTTLLNDNPVVNLSAYADSASSESGVSPGASSLARAGTLSYWSGSAFTTVALSSSTNGVYAVPTTTAQYGTTRVVLSGTVTVTAGSTTPSGSAPCATACTSKTNAGTVVASLSYTVFNGATQVGGFDVRVDLGSALAQTTYKAAPSA